MAPFLQDCLLDVVKCLNDNPGVLTVVPWVFGILGGLFAGIYAPVKAIRHYRRLRKLRVEVKAVEWITDPKVLLARVYGEEEDAEALSDHRIAYVQRDSARDIQAELRAALKTRYLLVTGRTGIGKTREAAILEIGRAHV